METPSLEYQKRSTAKSLEANDVGGIIEIVEANGVGGSIVDIVEVGGSIMANGDDFKQVCDLPPTHEHPALVRPGSPQQPHFPMIVARV